MATTVNVLCPNGRRVNVKVTPATTMLQVLEQVCEKQKFDPACHALKHHNKFLDLSNLFRYTNLPQNAKMEMVATDKRRTESTEVIVAVQCEDGQRVQGKFDPSATSLWGVLTKLGVCEFEGGRLEPVVAYTNNQICGEAALQKMTLRGLGLTSGRAVIRLLFRERQTDATGVEAGQSLRERKKEVAADVKGEAAGEGEEKMEHDGQGEGGDGKAVDNSDDQQMETLPSQTAEDDNEQPKSKPSSGATSSSRIMETSQSSVPKPSQSSQTGSAAASSTATTGGDSSEADIPYFPAHPFSYFSDDSESSATVDAKPPPPKRTGPVSMFDNVFSLYAISEDEPSLQAPAFESFQFPAVTSVTQAKSRSAPQAPPKVYAEPCDRETVVFHLDTIPMSPTVDVPDEFFDVTVGDVQCIHDDHKKQREALSDTPLMTQTMRMAQIEKKYESYDKAVVRVHFPNRWALQGCFRPRESLKALVKFIRDNMADPEVKFHLFTTPPKQVLKNGKMTFIEAGFVPAAIVYVGVESDHAPRPLLSEDSLKQAQSGLEAEVIMSKKRELKKDTSSSSTTAKQPRPQKSKSTSVGRTSGGGMGGAMGGATGGSGGGGATGEARKVPKWFKMGK